MLQIIHGSKSNLEHAATLALQSNRIAEFARLRARLETRAKLKLVWSSGQVMGEGIRREMRKV